MDDETPVESTETPQAPAPSAEKTPTKAADKLAARIAAAQAMKPGKAAAKEAPTDEDAAAPDETEGEEAEETPKEDAPTTPEARLGGVVEAFKGEDLKAAIKALRAAGVDTKLLVDVDRKHIALRKKAGHLKNEEKRILTVIEDAKREQAPLAASRSAYKRGDYYKAAKAIQGYFGDDWTTIVQNVTRGYAGLSAPERKALEKAAELEEREAKLRAKEAEKKPEAAPAVSRQTALTNIKDKAKGHDALSLKRGAELILLELEDSWDAKKGGFKISIREAADNVLREHGKKPAAKPPSKPPVPGTKKPVPFVPPAKKAPGKDDSDAQFAARVEMARRLSLSQKVRAS